jgi:hypothetical protein
MNALQWTAVGSVIAAAGAVLAAIGAWRTEATARWQARAERLRNTAARKENGLQRRRFTEIWQWWHDQPDGSGRAAAARWYTEWTGAARPYHGKDDGPMAPGIGSATAGEAYKQYILSLDIRYNSYPLHDQATMPED